MRGSALLFVVVLGMIIGSFTSVPAQTKKGKCLLVVDGKTHISGKCRIVMDFENDGGGSFEILEIRKGRGQYFAQVLVSGRDAAVGYWNGERLATHAHSQLGDLKRDGACWKNERARVCAWK